MANFTPITKEAIEKENKEIYKSLEKEGKILCKTCKEYWHDPKFGMCWSCYRNK